jgi:hypothetical protein
MQIRIPDPSQLYRSRSKLDSGFLEQGAFRLQGISVQLYKLIYVWIIFQNVILADPDIKAG